MSIVTEMDGIQTLDLKLHKKSFYKVRQNEIWDQRMDFFDPVLRLEYADYFLDYTDYESRDENQKHCSFDVLSVPDQTKCLPYLSYVFKATGEKRIITRKYPMFFSSLGEIGGTAEIVSLVFILLYSWYNHYFLGKYVKNQVFDDSVKNEFKSIVKEIDRERVKSKVKGGEAELKGSDKDKQLGGGLHGGGDGGNWKGEELLVLEDDFEELLDSNIEENESGMDLFKNLNELKILKRILLKPRHEVLIPPLILHLKKIERITRRMESNKKPEIMRSQVASKGKKKDSNSKLSLHQAYKKLCISRQGSSIERLIDDFMRINLQPYFEKNKDKRSKAIELVPENGTVLQNDHLDPSDQPNGEEREFDEENFGFEQNLKSEISELNRLRSGSGRLKDPPKMRFRGGAGGRLLKPRKSTKVAEEARQRIRRKSKKKQLRLDQEDMV